MAYQVNWITKVIFVPVSDMVLISGSDYRLTADSFWREIRRLEWDFTQGLWADQILEHGDTEELSGTTFVPKNKIINNYTITMDPLAQKVFLKGDNNNIIDVLNFNGVSVIPSNSAGNTVTEGSGSFDTDDRALLEQAANCSQSEPIDSFLLSYNPESYKLVSEKNTLHIANDCATLKQITDTARLTIEPKHELKACH